MVSWPGSSVCSAVGAATAVKAGTSTWHVERRAITDSVVADTWRRLQAAGGVPVPFMTYEWCSSLAEVPEAWSRLAVLLARRDSQPVALFPVEWTLGFEGRLGRWAQHLVALGPAGWQWLAPDRLDVVALPADRHGAAQAIGRHLVDHADWDLADFQGLDDGGALASALLGTLRYPSFAAWPKREDSPAVSLAGRNEHELLPSRNLRQQVRRGLRIAQRSGGGLEIVCDPERVAHLLEDLMVLHNARFGYRSRVFSTDARRRFHVLAATRLAAVGMARIYRLSSDGAHAALLYALIRERCIYYYSMGVAPDRGLSPGRTILGQAVLSAAEEGFEQFDLLRGDHDFKWRFADQTLTDLKIQALRLTPRNVVLASPLLSRRIRRRLSRAE